MEELQEWSLEGVLDELATIDRSMQDRQFAFILGSGASASSKIPTGKTLAQQWLRELHRREGLAGISLEEWVAGPAPGIEGLTFENAAQFYPQIFERRFRYDREQGYAALETAMEGKTPSLGYSLLAEIIEHTRHKVVVTTNFDNLVADALAMHAHRSPLVVAHESLAGFVRPQMRRPLVAKIHRDLFLSPVNDVAGVAQMEEGWTTALRKLFQYFTPVVVGYGGNDGSLMGFLEGLEQGSIAGRIIWCTRDGVLPERVVKVLQKHRGIKARIPGFDDFMLRLAAKLVPDFDVSVIAERTEKLGKERAEQYRQQAEKLQKSSATGSPEQRMTGQVLSQSAKADKDWWAWQLQVEAEPDLAKRDVLYQEGLCHFPESAGLIGNYALFLTNQYKDFDAAELMYRKALELGPDNVRHTDNYAIFLAQQRQNFDAAEGMYKKALALDPDDARTIGDYANFLVDQRKDFESAEVLYKKSLELDPGDSRNTCNYAAFLTSQRKDFSAAEAMYRKALELDGHDEDVVANFASLLLCKGDEASLNKVRPLLRQVLALSVKQPSPALAEAFLYGCLLSERLSGEPGADLGRLKALLAGGYERGNWDFSTIFERVLPHVRAERVQFYRALGDAVLREAAVAALDTFEVWRNTPASDPFAPYPDEQK